MPWNRTILASFLFGSFFLALTFAIMLQGEEQQKPENKNKSETKETISYYRQVRPLFQAHCQGCHQPAQSQGEYVMTSFAQLLKGGETGEAAIVPGQPDKSHLIALITPEEGEAEMPAGKPPLNPSQIEIIKTWISQGAKDDTPASDKIVYDMQHPPKYQRRPIVGTLDYSPDGKFLAVAGFHEVLLHKADGSGIVARLVGLSERITSVSFSPDSQFIAVTGGLPARLGEVQVWDVAKQKLTLSVPVTYDTLFGVSWSPDGKLIAFGCTDNTLRAIDAKTGKQVLFQGAHGDWILQTAFSKDGSHLISVGRDRTAKLTKVKTERFIDNITSITPGALKGGMAAVASVPGLDAVLVGGADGVPKMFRIFRQTRRVIGDNANLIHTFSALKGRIFDVAANAKGDRIAAVSSDLNAGYLLISAIKPQSEYPKDIKVILNKRVTSRSAAEKKKVVDHMKQGVKEIATADIKTGGLFAVDFNADGKQIAIAGSDGMVRILETETGKVIKEFSSVPLSKGTTSSSKNILATVKNNEIFHGNKLDSTNAIKSLSVSPSTVTIDHRYDHLQFVVTAELASGAKVDVTRQVKITGIGDNVSVSAGRVLRPLKDGVTKLSFALNGKSVTSTVTTKNILVEFHPDFMRDVKPTLTRLGCNAGTCHGANKGKAGFKLSLRGGDPAFDIRAFSDDHAGRRINFASPANSLMLLKATARVPHVGGQPTSQGSPSYEIVRQWIADGAPLKTNVPKVVSIELFPKNPIVQAADQQQQFRVVAIYSDGIKRDITADAFLETGDLEVALSNKSGLFTALRRGEAPVLARYEGAYAATTLTVMGDRDKFVWKDAPANNEIDKLVATKWKRVKTLPSGLCTDEEFIRRLSLDLTGIPPTSVQLKDFLADKQPTQAKRNKLIETFIQSKDFTELATNRWADLLQVNRKYLGAASAAKFRQWIRSQVEKNRPYNEFAYDILSASGSNRENPPASYYKIHRTPQDVMENSTHLFLGVRFNCNKCHDHPFEKWTQDQYYETAAFFARTGLKKDPASKNQKLGRTAVEKGKPLYEIVYEMPKGEVKHDRTGAITAPKFPFVAAFKTTPKMTRREKLAKWITSADNQYFARSYVNRHWGYLMGIGLIEPIDDIRAGNPATNLQLLDYLTSEFIKSGFDTRALIKLICQSRTYQLSIETNQWNEDDTLNYSHAIARRLPAEVLFDSIHHVTGSTSKIPGVPAGTRAIALPDSGVKLPSGFLAKFGRPPRESACECERVSSMQMGPVMAMISGPTISNAVADPKNSIAQLVASESDNKKLVNEIFMRILSRAATKDEIEVSLAILNEIPTDHKKLIAAWKKSEEKFRPSLEANAKARITAIKKAKAAYEPYFAKVADREKKLDAAHIVNRKKAEQALKDYQKILEKQTTAWMKNPKQEVEWTVIKPTLMESKNVGQLKLLPDGSILASGKTGKGKYRLIAETKLTGIRTIKLEALAHKSLPANGPGRAENGNMVLTEFELEAEPVGMPKKKHPVLLTNARADFSQGRYGIAKAIDRNVGKDNGWAISPQTGKSHFAYFDTKELISNKAGTKLTFTLKHFFSSPTHLLGHFRISVTNSTSPILIKGPPKDIAAIFKVKAEKRNKQQVTKLKAYYKKVDPTQIRLQKQVNRLKKPRVIDKKLVQLRADMTKANLPVPIDSRLQVLRDASSESKKQMSNKRLTAAQDITWALLNSPAFMFNR